MGIGGEDVALMVSRGSRSSGGLYRRLKVGEALDGYTLLRVEGDRVVMKAGATEVKVSIDDRPGGSAPPGQVRQAGGPVPDAHGPAHLNRGGVAEPQAGGCRSEAGPRRPSHPSRQSAGGHRPGRKAAGHYFHALRRHPALGRG